MKTRACVHCGCTDDRACRIPIAGLGADVVADVEFAMGRSLARGETVPCWWTSLNPPVCAAPGCQAKAKRKNRGGGATSPRVVEGRPALALR
jgi:hypothetical protein